MSSDALANAIKALIATATKYPCLDHDEVLSAGTLPATYTTIYLSRRFGGNVRGDSRENDLRRLQTRAVSTSISNARVIEDRTAALFAHSTLDVAGVPVHFSYESGGGEFDHDTATNRYHALTDWTFTV